MAVDLSMKLAADKPVYAQIVLELKRKILSGNVSNGDVLPSRRELAMTLGINPNTAQKAFKQLEDEKIIATPNNAPSYIDVDEVLMERIKTELTQDFVREFVGQAKQNKLTREDFIVLVMQMWEEQT